VQSAFGIVVVAVVLVGLVCAVVALIASRKTWEEYGRSHLLMDSEQRRPAASSPAALGERDDEIRQLLEARNARRRRRGEAPLDVESELSRLSTPQIDDELRAEIRQLVLARNHRRLRAGKEPLDVEAEIAREIDSLSGL
jgi:hypothetical protein